MTISSVVTDSYERRARLVPGLLAVVPLGVSLLAIGIEISSTLYSVGGLLLTAGLPVLLMDYVRERGLSVQESLYADWGGKPTTLLLRDSEPTSNPQRRERWRLLLSARVNIDMPNSTEEEDDPLGADDIYEAAAVWAREHTRDSQIVQEENRNYGFHRNLLGMRPIGISSSVLSTTGVGLWMLFQGDVNSLTIAGLAAGAGMTWFWIAYPTPSRVAAAAQRYAIQLFNTATSLKL